MRTRIVSLALASGLFIAACSGGDDTASTDPPTTDAGAPSTVATTVAASTTSSLPDTTTTSLVVDGATVVVANNSIVGGAAGRMTEELLGAGFTMGTPTNGLERLEDSVVHYTDDDGAEEVAESTALALGGVEVSAMPDPVPTETESIDGQVLVLLGNAQVDRTLADLGGADAVTTSGSVVVVANDSGVDGAAGTMTTTLENAGFVVGEPTDGVEQRAESIVYYTDDADAESDAEIIAAELGGVDVEPMPDEIPTDSGDFDGGILLLLGTNQVGKSLTGLNP
ncbi:MAG: LytR C-terminal domain-containing protein [Actinobacteria bacterium]|nr:LytR C-terminal domain-containing protein [Actinomycetota bacterium]